MSPISETFGFAIRHDTLIKLSSSPFYFLQVKLFRKPQEHAERIFDILVSHIKAHYDNGYRTYIASQIRLAVSGFYLYL